MLQTRSAVTRRTPATLAAALLTVALVAPATAAATRPKTIPLPSGFQPEGVAVQGNTFYAGSISTGAIFRGDLRTGEGAIFVPAQSGRSAIGLSLGDGMLFVAGGSTGQGYVYDATTGATIAVLQLTSGSSFVNDVVATQDAAYFTDSVNPFVYRVPIEGPGDVGVPQAIALTGDLVYQTGFNANGIDATPDGDTLVLVQSNTGRLFTVDASTGVTDAIDLGGESVVNGDGILLHGRTLWVVQNRDELLTKIRLSPDLASGEVVGRFTDATFDVPTTVARHGSRLVLVNARFGTPSPQSASYWLTQIRRPA
ncbi:MAG TPA: superoxide dismutase [Actinomycetota bacterium]|nr:superoxide dismutase [Actinomycetota bacterium]